MLRNSKHAMAAVLGLIALLSATGVAVFLSTNQQLFPASAWDCSKYNFSVSRQGIVTVFNESNRNEPPQRATVRINNTQVASYNVPALARGKSATLGTVSVPSNGTFTWEVRGNTDCRDGGSYSGGTGGPAPQCGSNCSPATTPSPNLCSKNSVIDNTVIQSITQVVKNSPPAGDFQPIGANENGYIGGVQSFKLPKTGAVVSLALQFDAKQGNPTGTINWFLRSDNGGKPGTIIIGNVFTPVENSINTIAINGTGLEAGKTYWIMLATTAYQNNGNYWTWRKGTNAYADGEAGSIVGLNYVYQAQSLPSDMDFAITVNSNATDPTSNIALGTPIDGFTGGVQSFKPLDTGIVTSFSVRLGIPIGNPTGTMNWFIRSKNSADNAGEPTSIIAGGVFDPISNSNNTITVKNGPTLTKGVTYYLMLTATAYQSNGNYWTWVMGPNKYIDGIASTIKGLYYMGEPLPTSQDMDFGITIAAQTPCATPTAAVTCPTGQTCNNGKCVLTACLQPGARCDTNMCMLLP